MLIDYFNLSLGMAFSFHRNRLPIVILKVKYKPVLNAHT